MSTCETIREQLVAYDDNELDMNERVQIKEHIDECQSCVQELDDLHIAMDMLDDYLESMVAEAPAEKAVLAVKPRFRFFTRIAAAASVLIAVSLMLYTLVYPTNRAYAAMVEVARQLADLEDFTAAFSRTFTFVKPQPTGDVGMRTIGEIRCRIYPEPAVRCTEEWFFVEKSGKEADITEKHESVHKRHHFWETSRLGGAATFQQDTMLWPRDVFEYRKGDEIVSPSPRSAAYVLKGILEDFRGGGYLKWFKREWVEDGNSIQSDKETFTFSSKTGIDLWIMNVTVEADGRLSSLRLSQSLTDSSGTVTGSLISEYIMTGINNGLGKDIFDVPKRYR